MSTFTEQLRQWSHQRQLLGRQAADPLTALEQVCGVYSAHPSGPLSLWTRLQSFDAAAMAALDAQQAALRTPGMRGSVYTLPSATAHLYRSACLPPAEDPSWAKRYSQKGREIPAEHYEDWKQELLQLLKAPLSIKELKPLTSVPDDKLKFVLNRMGYEGSLLRVGAPAPSSNAIGYVNASVWSNGQFQLIDQEAALRWLAVAYLKAFGPARRKDFQWWAGVTAGAAKPAWDAVEKVEVDKGWFLHPEDHAGFLAGVAIPPDTVDLLPQWDSYTMGYAPDGRARFVDPDFQDRIYGKLGATLGNGLGTILLDGLACAGWTSRLKGKELQVEIDYFAKPAQPHQQKIAAAFEELADFLQATRLKLTVE